RSPNRVLPPAAPGKDCPWLRLLAGIPLPEIFSEKASIAVAASDRPCSIAWRGGSVQPSGFRAPGCLLPPDRVPPARCWQFARGVLPPLSAPFCGFCGQRVERQVVPRHPLAGGSAPTASSAGDFPHRLRFLFLQSPRRALDDGSRGTWPAPFP